MGSGRSSLRALVEHSQIIDLPRMMKRGWLKDGHRGQFGMRFVSSGERLRVFYDLRDPHEAWLELNYRPFIRADMRPEIAQCISLTFTRPHFGGRRWWMVCDGQRVTKLYMPPGGDSFASREAWQLVYGSQRDDELGRAFSRLSRLQRKLWCEERWGAEPTRPKGMWRSRFQRLMAEFREADARCFALTEAMVSKVRRLSA
jgi:hypothetical protein